MILARRSSPAPSARHICRTKTKKTKSLTCLRHPLPSDSPRCRAVAAGGRGTKSGRHLRRGNFQRKGAKARSRKEFFALRSLRLGVNSDDFATELDSFTPPFLQICQSCGLRRLRVLRATKNSNAKCPKRPSQNDFGTAFVPTEQPEITCVAADMSPLHLKNLARKTMSRFISAATFYLEPTPKNIPICRSRGHETQIKFQPETPHNHFNSSPAGSCPGCKKVLMSSPSPQTVISENFLNHLPSGTSGSARSHSANSSNCSPEIFRSWARSSKWSSSCGGSPFRRMRGIFIRHKNHDEFLCAIF